MKENMTFEQAMTRLEEIVRMLEKGDAPLEKSLELFAEGTELIKYCGAVLDTAEQKVVMLRKGEDGAPEELPFEVELQ